MNKTMHRLLAMALAALMLFGALPAMATGEHVHQWGAWILDKQATCTEDGNEHRICSAPNCPQPNSREDKTIARLGHTWGGWNIKTQPTCTTAGAEQRFCTRCGQADPNTQNVPALGHSWGPWNVTAAPTCTTKGSQTRVCTRCAVTETQDIAALGHNWGAWVVDKAATCSVAGMWHRDCANGAACPEKRQSSAYGPLGKDQAEGHRFGEWKESKKANCQTIGEEQRTCGDCGRVETRQTKKGKHDVRPNWYALPEPSLERPGRKVRYCNICNKIVESQEYTKRGYTYEMPALNFGPRAKDLVASLVEYRDRFTPLDLTVEGETVYPLVTEDGYYIADLKVNVINDTFTVVYVMRDPNTIVKNELLFIFDDAMAVTAMDLGNVGASLRFGEVLPINGRSQVVMDARLLVNYDKEHTGNRPFSDNGVYLDGITQNVVILQEMTTKLTAPEAI